MVQPLDKDEMLHKMNKKIAQLTKVIFHLNTRNDENDLLQKATVDAYELEVDGVVKEANTKLQKSISMIDKLKLDSGSKQVEKLKSQYDNAKEKAQADLQKLRSEIEARAERATNQWTEKINKLESECKMFRDSLEQNEKTMLEFDEMAQKKLDRAVEGANALHATAIQKLKQDHAAEKAALSEQGAEANSKANSVLAEVQAQHDEALAKERKRFSEAQHGFAKEKEDLESLHQDALKKLQAQIDAERHASGASSSECAALQAKLEQIQSDHEQRVNELMASLDKNSKQFETEKADLNDLLAQAQRENAQYAGTIRQLERDSLSKDNDTLLARQRADRDWASKVEILENKVSGLEGKLGDATSELDSVRNRAKDLADNLDEARAGQDAESSSKAALQAELADANSQLGELTRAREEDVAKLSSDLELLAQKHQQAVRDAEEKFAADELALQGSEEQMKEMQAKHEADMAKLHENYQSNVEQNQKKWNLEREEMHAKVKHLEAEVAERQAALTRELELNAKNNKDEILMIQEEVARLEEELKQERSVRAEKQDTINRLQADMVNASQAAQDAARLHDKSLRETEAKYAEQISNMSMEHEREKTKSRNDFEYRLADLEARFAQEREDFSVSSASQTKQVAELQAHISKLEHLLEQNKSRAEGTLQGLKEEMNGKLKQTDKEYASKLEKMQREHLSNMEAQRVKAAADIESLQTRLQSSHQQYIAEVRQKYEAERENLKMAHEKDMISQREAHECAIHNMTESHNKKFSVLQSELSEEQAARIAERTNLEGQIEELQQSVKSGVESIAALSRQLDIASENVTNLEKTLEDTISKFEKQVSSLREQHDLTMQAKTQEHARNVAIQLQQHTAEMDVQKQQFQNALNHEKAVLQELESKHTELQRMYEDRPSRQEDLDKINELDAELQEREENYRKLWDEMNFYKLELHNREMNYNKMFGANPTVGTVDPTMVNQKKPPVSRRGSQNSMHGGR